MALFSEYESTDFDDDYDDYADDDDGPRMLRRGGGSRSRSSSKSSRGRVRLYFGSGSRSNNGGSCYENPETKEVECDNGASTVGIVIGSIVGGICIIICACYIYKNCNCCKASKDNSVSNFHGGSVKIKDMAASEYDKSQELGSMKPTVNYAP